MKGIKNTFWLNPDHGAVLPAYRILFILPCLSLLFAIIGTVARGPISCRARSRISESKELQIYAVVGLGLWGTMFPRDPSSISGMAARSCCVSHFFSAQRSCKRHGSGYYRLWFYS